MAEIRYILSTLMLFWDNAKKELLNQVLVHTNRLNFLVIRVRKSLCMLAAPTTQFNIGAQQNFLAQVTMKPKMRFRILSNLEEIQNWGILLLRQ